MKKVTILFLFILGWFNIPAWSQYTDRYWCFGDSAGIDFKNVSNPVPGESILRARGTCASICDSLGNLIFYGGSPHVPIWIPSAPPYTYNYGYIIDKNHSVISNGDSLALSYWYQDMIIVPNPGNANQFYIFTCGVTTSVTGLFYSLVDMSLNNGDGYVIQKNIRLQNFKIIDALAAVKHGNGRDWWLVAKQWDYNTFYNDFYVYLVSPSGVAAPIHQNIGTPVISTFQRTEFTKDGNRIYSTTTSQLVERFDFDRCTGMLSNLQQLYNNTTQPGLGYWHFAISPDESKMYTTTYGQGVTQDTCFLVQYDLNAPNFIASAETLYTLAGDDNIMGLLQLGPDDKIYMSCMWNKYDCDYDYLYCDTTWSPVITNLSVINYPDSLGAACDFQPFSFNLGGHRSYIGLPNNPNYELGPLVGSPCDTLTVGIADIIGYKNNITVFYDDSWQTAFINAKGLKGKKYTFELYNINGQLLQQQQSNLDSEYYTNNLSMVGFSDGLYVVKLKTDKEVLTGKFVKR
jgi:hypothetical protein